MRRLGHTAGARVDLGKFLYIEVYIFLEECIGAFESSLPAETVTRCCIHTPSFAMTQKKKVRLKIQRNSCAYASSHLRIEI